MRGWPGAFLPEKSMDNGCSGAGGFLERFFPAVVPVLLPLAPRVLIWVQMVGSSELR